MSRRHLTVVQPGQGVVFGRIAARWLSFLMNPIQVPAEWDDNGIILFEEFCHFIRTPQRTVRDWRRCGRGPRWWRFNGNGRLFTTVAELRRFLRPAAATSREAGNRG